MLSPLLRESIIGTHGKAWDLLPPPNVPMNAGIAQWIVHAPWAHPAWQNYVISLIHLRPLEGMEPAQLYHPTATHEVIVAALDPSKPLVNDDGFTNMLSPVNYAEQFTMASDDDAIAYVKKTVQDICNGLLSPDTDFKADWAARFPHVNPGRRRGIPNPDEAGRSSVLSAMGGDGQSRTAALKRKLH